MTLKEIPKAIDELKRAEKVYVMCRRGNASKEATELLLSLGINQAVNVEGGMDAIRREIDPSLPNY